MRLLGSWVSQEGKARGVPGGDSSMLTASPVSALSETMFCYGLLRAIRGVSR